MADGLHQEVELYKLNDIISFEENGESFGKYLLIDLSIKYSLPFSYFEVFGKYVANLRNDYY